MTVHLASTCYKDSANTSNLQKMVFNFGRSTTWMIMCEYFISQLEEKEGGKRVCLIWCYCYITLTNLLTIRKLGSQHCGHVTQKRSLKGYPAVRLQARTSRSVIPILTHSCPKSDTVSLSKHRFCSFFSQRFNQFQTSSRPAIMKQSKQKRTVPHTSHQPQHTPSTHFLSPLKSTHTHIHTQRNNKWRGLSTASVQLPGWLWPKLTSAASLKSWNHTKHTKQSRFNSILFWQ